jgi:predicted GH43/DUF377 family glycosyl hydrolase
VKVFRSPHNPIIRPEDVKPSQAGFEVIGVFNAGAARLGDNVVLLLRVAERPVNDDPAVVLTALYEISQRKLVRKKFSVSDPEVDFSDPRLIKTTAGTYLTSISHFRLARSKDGIHFDIEEAPAICPETAHETFGVEDPRITVIDGTYYIDYVAVSALGVTTCLVSTQDFRSFRRHGVIFCPDNKDVALFPEKIGDRFYALHRPVSPLFGKQDIWLAESPDLMGWGNHRHLFGPRVQFWDEAKVGAGAVPLKVEQGWLEVYHGVDRDNRYCLGAVLLDGDEPWKVLARSTEPIFEPETRYECAGFFGNVVFTCGLLHEGDTLKLYYGAADTTICYAELSLQEIVRSLQS